MQSGRGFAHTHTKYTIYTDIHVYTWVMVVLRIGFTGHAEWEGFRSHSHQVYNIHRHIYLGHGGASNRFHGPCRVGG